MTLFYNWCGSNRLQVKFIVLELKYLGQKLEYSYSNQLYEPRREKRFFGVHAPDSPACVHVDTETNSRLFILD